MRFHVYLLSTKAHALGLKPETLFHGRFATQFDFAARAEDSLPGQSHH